MTTAGDTADDDDARVFDIPRPYSNSDTDLYRLHSAGYADARRPDPRIAAHLCAALSGLRSIVNIGAGTGSYEPHGMKVIAVEPSWSMLCQRTRHSAPVLQGRAESLPLRDGCVDAALAVLTLHHWQNQGQGLRECLRVARQRVLLLTLDAVVGANFWLTRDYFPEIQEWDRRQFPALEQLQSWLGPISVEAIPIAADCMDGFLGAYWRRPWAYLDARVRAGMSAFGKIRRLDDGLQALRRDLETGVWERRYGYLLTSNELDIGYRLVIAQRSC